MPIELEKFPADFYSRKLNIVILLRETDQEPQTMEDYFAALNLKANCIQTLGFLLGGMSKFTMRSTNPENLNMHLETLAFLIMSFAAQMHDDADNFKEKFDFDK